MTGKEKEPTLSTVVRQRLCLNTIVAAGVLLCSAAAGAQGTFSLQPPLVGSANTADADPPVIRPTTTPCKVQLFSAYQFKDFAAQTFSFAPPTDCPGPWSKVVFVGDFTVDGTDQYDRTAQILLGDTMIYYGTTAEPTPTEQPSWHVESDLTDYSALFRDAQQGTVVLNNRLIKKYNGVQTGSAYLQFYPADFRNRVPRTADEVLPLPDLQQSPGAQALNTSTDTISQVFTLPANVESAYLDVFTQGQNDDEIWWDSFTPNPFRETEVTLDGKPAGLAPIYPYFYTGTINSTFWQPIPGIQTLSLKPYRVDLTPFVGILDNGEPHTIAVSLYNAHDYFNADATLLVFEDHGAQSTSGELLSNTLDGVTAPTFVEDTANGKSTATTTYAQSYTIKGYVNTSHGQVATEVESSLSFSNANVVAGTTGQVNQMTTTSKKSTTRTGFLETTEEDALTFPFVYSSVGQTTSLNQGIMEDKKSTVLGVTVYESHLHDHVAPIATQASGAAGTPVSEPVDTSNETYQYTDTAGHCWSRQVSASDAKVSAVHDGQGCPNGVNHWQN